MKILLINAPIRLNAPPSCIPYGLATIAATLRAEEYEIEILDLNALRPSREETIAMLEEKTWDVAGVSGLITTYKFQKWLIPVLKQINSDAPVVSGGGLVTSNATLLFDHSPVDIAVLGEGEQTMLDLCRALEISADLSTVDGIWFRRNGQIHRSNPRTNITDLDQIPFPAWDLLPIEIYLSNPIWGDVAANSSGFRSDVKVTFSMNIIASRGCPFGCRYCFHLFGRSNYRLRSPENVVAEIETLYGRYRVDFIGIVDDNMMVDQNRLYQFCDLMMAKNLPLTWGCHGRVTSAAPEILKHMAAAGCVWIGYGIESGSQKILTAMNKRATVNQAKAAITATRDAGIYPNTTFIFGYPGETRETIQETVDFKREMGLECGSFFATPYPGTPLYDQVKGRITDEEAFVAALGNATDFCINLTDFDDATLFELKKTVDNNQDVYRPDKELSHGI